MRKAPCEKCEERTPGCHDRCARYLAYKIGREVAAKKARDANAIDQAQLYGHRRVRKSRQKEKRGN